MSETKTAFAERARRSLKNILYPYMEDKGYKYIHKWPQFVSSDFCKEVFDLFQSKNCPKVRIFIQSLQQTFSRVPRTKL